jgi:hypothetical protein
MESGQRRLDRVAELEVIPVNEHDHRAATGLTVGHPVTVELQLADPGGWP